MRDLLKFIPEGFAWFYEDCIRPISLWIRRVAKNCKIPVRGRRNLLEIGKKEHLLELGNNFFSGQKRYFWLFCAQMAWLEPQDFRNILPSD